MFKILDIPFAEKGFYINLDSSIERKENIENQILKFGLTNLERFPALTDEMHHSSCTKSHKKVFEFARENNLEIIFVGEDDFQIYENCRYYGNTRKPLTEVLTNIKKDLDTVNWDAVLLGCNPTQDLKPITDNLAICYKSTGGWAYIIKKRAYEFILDNFEYRRDYLAIDNILPLLNDHGFVTLTTIPKVISHAVGFISTLQPKGPVNYDVWIEGSYDKHLYSPFFYYDENNQLKIKKP